MRIDRAFEKDLKKIKDKALRSKIADILENFMLAESVDQIRQVKKLKGETVYYRVKIGDYRLGFTLEQETITAIRFLH